MIRPKLKNTFGLLEKIVFSNRVHSSFRQTGKKGEWDIPIGIYQIIYFLFSSLIYISIMI